MLDNPQSAAGIITKPSSQSVAETVDRLRRLIEDRGFTLFRVIDHSGTAERVGEQMPESKLVMFGKPTATTSRVPCVRPSTQLSRSLRQYLVHLRGFKSRRPDSVTDGSAIA